MSYTNEGMLLDARLIMDISLRQAESSCDMSRADVKFTRIGISIDQRKEGLLIDMLLSIHHQISRNVHLEISETDL